MPLVGRSVPARLDLEMGRTHLGLWQRSIGRIVAEPLAGRFSLLRLRLDQALQLLTIDEGAAIAAPSIALEQPFPHPSVERRLADLELADGVVGGDQVRH